MHLKTFPGHFDKATIKLMAQKTSGHWKVVDTGGQDLYLVRGDIPSFELLLDKRSRESSPKDFIFVKHLRLQFTSTGIEYTVKFNLWAGIFLFPMIIIPYGLYDLYQGKWPILAFIYGMETLGFWIFRKRLVEVVEEIVQQH